MELHKAEALALELMKHHGLMSGNNTMWPWRFEFDRSVRRFGVCKYRTRTIGLSAPIVRLNDEAKVRDTILHEIAHALAGNAAGHGWAWKAVCVKIGAKPERCYDSNEVEQPEGNWSATCPGCTKKFNRTKAPRFGRQLACKDCLRKYGQHNFPKLALTFVRRGQVAPVVPFVPDARPVRTTPTWWNPPVAAQVPAPVATPEHFLAKPFIVPPTPPVNVMLPSNSATFSVQRCVELYTSGVTKLIDLAEQMGYPRGHGQTRCKRVLVKAGVFKEVN